MSAVPGVIDVILNASAPVTGDRFERREVAFLIVCPGTVVIIVDRLGRYLGGVGGTSV
jgi:hypothetical protein